MLIISSSSSSSYPICLHYDDVIMTTIASQITSLTVVYLTVYSDRDQRKHQSSASPAFVWGIHRDRWIPRTRASYAENVSIWWRHHDHPSANDPLIPVNPVPFIMMDHTSIAAIISGLPACITGEIKAEKDTSYDMCSVFTCQRPVSLRLKMS